jgi:hypothetical protein
MTRAIAQHKRAMVPAPCSDKVKLMIFVSGLLSIAEVHLWAACDS